MTQLRRGGNRRKPAARPVSGPSVELLVESLGAGGDGVAHLDGRPVFLPFALPGERVMAKLGPVRSVGQSATVERRLSEAAERIAPTCPHFGRCGGCRLQHLAPAPYADFKREQIRLALARRGLEADVLPPLVSPPGSRRRLILAMAAGRLGLHPDGSHEIVDLEVCPVADPRLVALLPDLRRALGPISRSGRRDPIGVTLTVTESGIDLLVAAPRDPELAEREDLAALAERLDLARVSWVAAGGNPEPLAARRRPLVRFGAIDVGLPPGAFLQATAAGEAAILAAVRAALPSRGRIVDLFAGVGTIALPLADAGHTVTAVELDAPALGALKAAANARGLALDARRRDLFSEPYDRTELNNVDGVVFDPPRAGAAAQAAELAESDVPVVIAVSCHPGSFARDARALVDGGYRLGSVQPIDQFLWSAHVELVASFKR